MLYRALVHRASGGAAAVMLLTGAGRSEAKPLPDGLYHYVVIDSGKPAGTSTIHVSRSNDAIVIEERASPMEEGESSRRELDPATFAVRSYRDGSAQLPFVTLTIDGESATLRRGTSTATLQALPGAPFVVFDYYVGSFFGLAAVLHAAQPSTMSFLDVAGGKVEPMAVSPSIAERPDGIPATDASTAVTIEEKIATLWYDPQTFVLDEMDAPAARISYKRVRP
jgi:hypothetical protein